MVAQPVPHPRVALYLRVSTSDQKREGYSLPHQRAALEAYAAREGWTVVGVWVDAETGRRDDRTNYQLMLADKTWDTLLVWRCDRLGRDNAELHRVSKLLARTRRRLVSATEDIDTAKPNHFLNMGLRFLFAEQESRDKSERVTPVMLRLAAEGRHLSTAPLGYRMRPAQIILDEAGAVVRKEAARLVVDEAGAALYREAVRRVLAGESIRAITRDWNCRGIPTARAVGQWDYTVLAKLLRNPIHAGMVRWNGLAEPVKGQHEALISRAEWDALQARIDAAGRAWSNVTTRDPSHLLTGFGRCACGAALIYHNTAASAGRRPYLSCRGKRHGRTCPVPGMVRAEAVEQAVRWVLSPMLTKDAPALLAHYRDADSIDYDAAARAAERARARLTAEQDRAERQLANLIDMRAAGEMTSDEYQAARARALSSRDQAAAALAALPEPSMTPMADPDATARLLGSLGALYHDPDAGMVQRRELLTLLGVAVTREPDGVWVRVAPAWRPWTRGDTFFPMVRAGLVVPSDAEGKPYAPERTIESDPIAAD